MKKAMRFFLMIALSCLPAAAAEEMGMFYSAVPDYTSVEIMGVPVKSTDVSSEKAMARSHVLDRMLQSTVFSAFSREQLSFTPNWVSLTPVSKGPELLAYQHGVMPVQQDATPKGDRNLFVVKSTEFAVISVQYAHIESVTDSRIEAKRPNDRKSGGST
jgi:hypothetical protein